MDATQQQFLEEKALAIRRSIIQSLSAAQSGHSAGALGMADVYATLYFHVLNHKPKQPDWPDRDRVLLSNGHTCAALYATLAEAGYFPKDELLTFRQLNSRLQGHPHRGEPPGVENTSGPLGQGLSQACGLALAFQRDNLPYQVFALLSDAEQQEGQTWEAYLFAGHYQLRNLTVLIDRNNIQIEGNVHQVMDIEPFAEKLTAFNWSVVEVDGHNIPQIADAFEQTKHHQKPSAIICHTIPGKGVSFMEHDYAWHGKPPSKEEAELALKELA